MWLYEMWERWLVASFGEALKANQAWQQRGDVLWLDLMRR